MSSTAPAATPCDPEAESPLAAGEPIRYDVIREDEPGASDVEDGELDDDDKSQAVSDEETNSSQSDSPNDAEDAAPPLPNETVPSDAPPLPNEAVPTSEDDGWDCQWDANTQAWFFFNRFTGQSQWENPRVSSAANVAADPAHGSHSNNSSGPQPPTQEKPAAGGYNPAIHGDYDPNAWYAQGSHDDEEEDISAAAVPSDPSGAYGATAAFNRFTGSFQTGDVGPERHSDEAKARRQMNAYFDVDAAANAHGGRSLKAERSNKKPTKSELKAFKEKRRARKEEKRRAWLRD